MEHFRDAQINNQLILFTLYIFFAIKTRTHIWLNGNVMSISNRGDFGSNIIKMSKTQRQ